MRIEVEDNRVSLDEFVRSLIGVRGPVELTRGGEVVATVALAKKSALKKSEAPASDAVEVPRKSTERLRELIQKARANTKRLGLSERQAVKMACDAVDMVRKQDAAARRD